MAPRIIDNRLDAGAESRLHVSMRTKPEDAYAAAQVESARLLAEITRLLAAHQDARAPEEVTWGAVGDLQATIEKLGEVRSFLANEG